MSETLPNNNGKSEPVEAELFEPDKFYTATQVAKKTTYGLDTIYRLVAAGSLRCLSLPAELKAGALRKKRGKRFLGSDLNKLFKLKFETE
jgi:hypothetical protein